MLYVSICLLQQLVEFAYQHRVGQIVEFHCFREELCVVVQSAMTSILDFIRVQFDLISGAECG